MLQNKANRLIFHQFLNGGPISCQYTHARPIKMRQMDKRTYHLQHVSNASPSLRHIRNLNHVTAMHIRKRKVEKKGWKFIPRPPFIPEKGGGRWLHPHTPLQVSAGGEALHPCPPHPRRRGKGGAIPTVGRGRATGGGWQWGGTQHPPPPPNFLFPPPFKYKWQ